MITLEEMDRIEVFKNLSDDQLSTIQEFCNSVEFQKNDRLFGEGDEAKHLWVIIDGQVDLRFELPNSSLADNESTISSVKSQSSEAKTLGWSCFVPPYKMRLSAYCTTRTCRVVKIEKENLLKLFEQDSQMGYQVMQYLIRVLGYRFEQFQDEVARDQGNKIMHSW